MLAARGEDEGDVDFVTYLHALNSFKKYLSAISSDVSKDSIDWIVKDLHHSRPTILLEGRSETGSDNIDGVVNLGINWRLYTQESKPMSDLKTEQEVVVTEAMVDRFRGIWSEWSYEGDNIEYMESGATPDLRRLFSLEERCSLVLLTCGLQSLEPEIACLTSL